MTGRGVVGEKWSQRILWICALGSAISLYMAAVERQAQNRAKMVGLEASKGSGESSQTDGQDV